MNILFLYGNERAFILSEWLREKGHNVILIKDRISTDFIKDNEIDLIISFTYRFHIHKSIVTAVNGNAVNLHISYLPWNKGADPNIWSWIDDTPKGVSIHFISDEIDGGDIISQRIVPLYTEEETLSSSYDKLMDNIVLLFQEVFLDFSHWREMAHSQVGMGSKHASFQLKALKEEINYHIPISSIIEEIKPHVK